MAQRVIVLRPGAIGDTLLTFPALHALRQRFPGAELAVVGNRPALELGRATGVIDRADAFGADWVSDLFGDEPTPALRDRLEGIDLGIVWLHDSAAATDLARRLERAGVRQGFAAASFPPAHSGIHLAEHLLATLSPLGVSGTSSPIDQVWLPLGSDLTPGHPGKGAPGLGPTFAVLHPGAGGRYKRWPAERFVELVRRLRREGADVALTRGVADVDAVEAVCRTLGGSPPRILAELSLRELADRLARADVFVGNDSGITHLAAMLGVPTVALFGPYDPDYWRPIGPNVVVVDAGLVCPHRSDPREGCRSCASMEALDVETVWSALEQGKSRGA